MTDGLDAITLHGMSFHTLVGVLPHEREHPQPIEIDLTAWVRSGDDVVDYRRLYAEVRDLMESSELFYLEELADSIATRILDEFAVEREAEQRAIFLATRLAAAPERAIDRMLAEQRVGGTVGMRPVARPR